MGADPESCLLVCLPEVDRVVAPIRARLDSNTGLGIPAHVTVLAPFVPADRLDEDVVARLAVVFSRFDPFEVRLDQMRWFGSDVLWLAPADDRPFRRLTDEVFAAFPGFPPFGGVFEDVIPHLTVGLRQPVDQLRAAESELSAALPITARAEAVTLFVQPDGAPPEAEGGFQPERVFPLGQGRGGVATATGRAGYEPMSTSRSKRNSYGR